MKKISVLFLLPLFAFNFLADWQTVKLDERFSMNFPGTPKESEMSGNEVWIVDINSSARCMAMVTDFKKYDMSAAELAKEFGGDNALEQFRIGMLQQMDGAHLISEKVSTTQGYNTFEYLIDLGKGTGQHNYMYNKNIFVGTKMYSINFYQAELKKSPENERFFNSIKIN